MKLALAQFNLTVGDIAGNTDCLLAAAREAHAAGASILLTPEMSISGYPAEDLVQRADFCAACAAALARIAAEAQPQLALIVGYPERSDDGLFNAAALVRGGRVEAVYCKHHLPNYSVFDEQRVFASGDAAVIFACAGLKFAITICGDIWEPGPMAQAKHAGADWLLVLNASPFHLDKQAERYAVARARQAEAALPIVYANLLGGQDELVFDGASFAMDAGGDIVAQYPAFAEGVFYLELDAATAHGENTSLPSRTTSARTVSRACIWDCRVGSIRH
jgi:NAD+ synthase (glutamine-hydrolysing)